jgi:hypothetical protein
MVDAVFLDIALVVIVSAVLARLMLQSSRPIIIAVMALEYGLLSFCILPPFSPQVCLVLHPGLFLPFALGQEQTAQNRLTLRHPGALMQARDRWFCGAHRPHAP